MLRRVGVIHDLESFALAMLCHVFMPRLSLCTIWFHSLRAAKIFELHITLKWRRLSFAGGRAALRAKQEGTVMSDPKITRSGIPRSRAVMEAQIYASYT